MLTIFGDRVSGNCLKVLWTADWLGLSYQWRDIDILAGGAATREFLALNPAGQVPVLVLEDGRALAQSNAIILHLAEASPLIPTGSYARAKMLEWLFWEQYSHEPYVAVARFQMKFLGKPLTDLDPKLHQRGGAALARMEIALANRRFLIDDALTLADIALVAYTRVAHEGGFDLGLYPAVSTWVARTEDALSIKT